MRRTGLTLFVVLAACETSMLAQGPSESAALALAESANLLLIQGRTCPNGMPAPMKDPEWSKFVRELRDAGMSAYKAARAKDQEKMIATAETLSAACAGCHRKRRDRRTPANRCK